MEISEFIGRIVKGKKLAILAGAGISIPPPSNLLSGSEFITSFLDVLAPDSKTRDELIDLCTPGRPDRKTKGDFLRFEALMEILHGDVDPNLSILNYLDTCDAPNMNHYVLALLIKNGHKVLTTNFDNLIEIACQELGFRCECYASEDDFKEYLKHNSGYPLFKLHGTLRKFESNAWTDSRSTIKATLDSVARSGDRLMAEPSKLEVFTDILKSYDLFIVGYSGYDDFDICPLIANTVSDKKLVWINHCKTPSMLKWSEFRNFPKDSNGEFIETRDEYLHMISNESNENAFRDNQNVYFVNYDTAKFLEILTSEYQLSTDIPSPARDYRIDKKAYFEDWGRQNLKTVKIRHHLIGRIYRLLERYDSAIEHFELCIDERNRDSLSQILTTVAFENIAFIYIELSDFGRSLDTLQRALSYCKKENMGEMIASVYHLYGMNYLSMGDFGIAEEYYQKSYEVYEDLGVQLKRSDLLFELGRIKHRLGKHDESLSLLHQAYELNLETGKLHGSALCLHEMGMVYGRQGYHDRAIDHYQQSIALKEKLGYAKGIATSYRAIGIAYQEMRNNHRAIEFHQKSLALSELVGDKSGVASNLLEMGIIYFELSNYDKALECQRKSLRMNEQITNKSGLSKNLIEIGTILKKQRNFQDALSHYEKGLGLIRQTMDPFAEAVCLYQIGLLRLEMEEVNMAMELFIESRTIMEHIGADKGYINRVQSLINELESR